MTNQTEPRIDVQNMIAETQRKVDTALSGLNLEELMQINLQASRVEQQFNKEESEWHRRSFEESDKPAPQIPQLPELTPAEMDTRWHERLSSLVGEDKRFDHLVLGLLRQTLSKKARENPVL